MSVIIYGVRPYGTVDAHGGEYAETRFFHLWFVPLIPTGSNWITGHDGKDPVGFAIDMHGKSVLAGFLRVWGPVAALVAFGAAMRGYMSGLVISAIAIALTVLSWTWRNVRGEAARRRSDFNLVAFGTRCEPHRLNDDTKATFKAALDERWNNLKPDRTPNEIAQHGTKSAHEAITAYGLLRIAGAMRGRAGRAEDADADRILAGAHTAQAVGEGPYREGVQDTPTGSLDAVVTAMARAHQLAHAASPEARAALAKRDKWRSRKQLLALILATPFAAGGVMLFVDSIRPTREVSVSELRSMSPPVGRTVRVTCDSVSQAIWSELDSRGNATENIVMCELGEYLLPVRLDADATVPQRTVEGKLRNVHERLIWVRQGLSREPEIEARSLEVFVDASDPNERIFLGIFGLAIALSVPVLWVLWFRARRRRKASPHAGTAT